MTTTPPDDMFLLRQTLGIARQARRNGKHPGLPPEKWSSLK